MQTDRINLYYEDNPYETEEVYIEIINDEIFFHERTSEKCPGERYGFLHIFDKENTKKLLECLTDGGKLKIEDCFKSFCGKDSARRFKEYCKTNSINYRSFLS